MLLDGKWARLQRVEIIGVEEMRLTEGGAWSCVGQDLGVIVESMEGVLGEGVEVVVDEMKRRVYEEITGEDFGLPF